MGQRAKKISPHHSLEHHFHKQPLGELAQRFEALEGQIAVEFLEQFRRYKYQVLGLVAENMDVVEHPDVQKAIARETSRVVDALSRETGAEMTGQITAEIFSAANNNIRKI